MNLNQGYYLMLKMSAAMSLADIDNIFFFSVLMLLLLVLDLHFNRR